MNSENERESTKVNVMNDYSIFEYNVKDNDIKTKMFHVQAAGGADERQYRLRLFIYYISLQF